MTMHAGVDASPLAKLLAFDTSTERMAVALSVDGRVFSRDEAGGARASAALLPTIFGLLDEAGATLADLDAIAFGCGPGAFTGLRTACAVAQGLALGLTKPLLPIASLLIVAEDARRTAELDVAGNVAEAKASAPRDADAFAVWACIDARMGEIYAAEYVRQGGHWQQRRAPMLVDCAALDALWAEAPPANVAGDALIAYAGRLHPGAAVEHPQARPRAAALLGLAAQAWHRGEAVDVAEAAPLYVRDRVASTMAEREQQRAAAS